MRIRHLAAVQLLLALTTVLSAADEMLTWSQQADGRILVHVAEWVQVDDLLDVDPDSRSGPLLPELPIAGPGQEQAHPLLCMGVFGILPLVASGDRDLASQGALGLYARRIWGEVAVDTLRRRIDGVGHPGHSPELIALDRLIAIRLAANGDHRDLVPLIRRYVAADDPHLARAARQSLARLGAEIPPEPIPDLPPLAAILATLPDDCHVVLVCDGRHLRGWHDPGLLLHRFGVITLFQRMTAALGNVDPALVTANRLLSAQAGHLPIDLALRHGNARIDRVVFAFRQDEDGTSAVRIVVDGVFDSATISGILGEALPLTPLLLEREHADGRAVIGSLTSTDDHDMTAAWTAAFAHRPEHAAIRLLAPRPPPTLDPEILPLPDLARGAVAIASEATGTTLELDLDFLTDAAAAAFRDLLQRDPFAIDPPVPPAPAGPFPRGRSLIEMIQHDQLAAAWAARHWESEGRRIDLGLRIPEASLPAMLRHLLVPDFGNQQVQQWYDPDRPFTVFDPLMKPFGP